jgi:hypothetical protein
MATKEITSTRNIRQAWHQTIKNCRMSKDAPTATNPCMQSLFVSCEQQTTVRLMRLPVQADHDSDKFCTIRCTGTIGAPRYTRARLLSGWLSLGVGGLALATMPELFLLEIRCRGYCPLLTYRPRLTGLSRQTIPNNNSMSHVPSTQPSAMKNPHTNQTSIAFAVIKGTGSIVGFLLPDIANSSRGLPEAARYSISA